MGDEKIENPHPSSSPERPTTAHRVEAGGLDDNGTWANQESKDVNTMAAPTLTRSVLDNMPTLAAPSAAVAQSSFLDSPSFDGKHSDSQAELAVREHLLNDMESSFAAPPSPLLAPKDGVEDTFDFDSPSKKEGAGEENVKYEEQEGCGSGNATSSLEGFSSSPTAAAYARTVSRLSRATIRGQADANDGANEQTPDHEGRTTPTDAGHTPGHALLPADRQPKYLRSRHASQQSSVSSLEGADDGDSNGTNVGLGLDYALPSVGAMLLSRSVGSSRAFGDSLTRSGSAVSMGSLASGMDEGLLRDFSFSGPPPLETLNETTTTTDANGEHDDDDDDDDDDDEDHDLLRTPRAKPKATALSAPTDTVIARHVRNVQVPESLAREYKSKSGLVTPYRPATSTWSGTATSRHSGRNLTLKEQSSTIERLSKENFDLKLKVMFLSDRLDKLSEEGVKEMISENVELRMGLAVLQRDNKGLRRRVKELEKMLKEEDEGRSGTARGDNEDDAYDQEAHDREEELIYLREQIEEHVAEVERLRSENMQKEAERRRMVDVVKTLGERHGDRRAEDVERQEEADVWKDLHEQETCRREQGDEDNRRLREEMFRLKQEVAGITAPAGLHHTTNIYNITKKGRAGSPSRPVTALSGDVDANGTSTTSHTLVEELRRETDQLRHENAELRREVGAQTSMLTSRNREKERLYQEIEDLKMARRRGGAASSAVDSLLERSASRADGRRSVSGFSGGTGTDEAEREATEAKLAAMRDRTNEVTLANHELQRELDSCMEDFERAVLAKKEAEALAESLHEDLEAANQDAMALQAERDQALRTHAALEREFVALRREAQEEIDELEGEADQRCHEKERLRLELADRNENLAALQHEMRKMSEAVVRLEDEQDNKLRRIAQLEQDLHDANGELEDLEAKLREANDKADRLAVQQESSQNELAFLREEQEGDKMRIGDLEAAVAAAEQTTRDERERGRELEQRIVQERRQREMVAGREREEVQQLVDELNRDAQASRDEVRRLRKSLKSRETEATEWKGRLLELENKLREVLEETDGTASSLLACLAQRLRDLEKAMRELDEARAQGAEQDRMIKQRDALLENLGLESRKVGDLLDKERRAHRAIRAEFDTFQKTQAQYARTAAQRDELVIELEAQRQADKRRLGQLEGQAREQLSERNRLLLVLWTRLSTLCGRDWAHDNSLVDGRALPSVEVVASMLPGFAKNLLAAVDTVETTAAGAEQRVRAVEKELWREYRALEGLLEQRTRKLDRLEVTVGTQVARAAQAATGTPQAEYMKLEEAYRRLKVENHTLRTAAEVRSKSRGTGTDARGSPSPSVPTGPRDKEKASRAETTSASSVVRTTSATTMTSPVKEDGAAEGGEEGFVDGNDMDKQWMLRLRDLEQKLKAEREARLLDRGEAIKRLTTSENENLALREALEREKRRSGR